MRISSCPWTKVIGAIRYASRAATPRPIHSAIHSEMWPWLSLIGLGAFHGLNPAMGWLFSVGLGLQHKSRAKVLWSLLPIALGHALSIALVVAAVVVLREKLDVQLLQFVAAATLIAFGVYRLAARHRPPRASLQADFRDLALWSFLLATGHGAGLMLLPVLLHMPGGAADVPHAHVHAAAQGAANGALATMVHSAAMLATTGLIAILVYDWVGLGFLRRGWINLDWIWAFALIFAGAVLILESTFY